MEERKIRWGSTVRSTNTSLTMERDCSPRLGSGESRGEKTEADIRALIDLADAVTLENLAEVLAHSHDPDDRHASVQLEAIAFATATPAIRDTRLRPEGASTELIRPRSAWPVHHRDLMTKAW